MYKIKFNDVTLISNKKKIQKNKIIFFFMVLVVVVMILHYFLKFVNKKYQLIIPNFLDIIIILEKQLIALKILQRIFFF